MKTKRNMLALAVAVAALLVAIPGDSSAQGGGRGKGKGKQEEPASQVQFKLGPVTGNVANGRDLFIANTCYGCHGYNGETGARDLVGRNSPILANEETFVLFLRQRADQAPLLPSTAMPNFPVNAISDREAKDIYAYIRSFKLDAPAIQDVPTLKEILESAEKPYKP
jgi:mono/diheme cytochrome c family protein